ncbi:MAG: hypothetical protein IPK82_03990 [Polyangiaceae bacterium]|nr:hypothetical protein [Polyangiaceae bacterium]
MSDKADRRESEEPTKEVQSPPAENAEDFPEDEGAVSLDEVDVRDLLRSALEPPPPKPKQQTALLKGVQHRLRVRSKGKFYADGWSTSKSPRSTYLVTSIFMLLLIAFIFLVLIPWSNGALP